MSEKSLKQNHRVIVLVVNIILLAVFYRFMFNSWFPTSGAQDLWMFSIVGYWIFSLVVAPYFVPPRDALGYTLTVAIILATADLSSITILHDELVFVKWASVAFSLTTMIFSLIAIAFKDADEKESSFKYQIAIICYNLSTNFGKSEIVFTPPILISIVGFFYQDPIQLMLLTTLWVLVAFIKPVELIIKIFLIIKSVSIFTQENKRAGTINRVDDPNIVRISLLPDHCWEKDNLHIARLHGGDQVYVLPLFSHLQEDERIGTGLISRTVDTRLVGIDEDSCGVYEAFDNRIHAQLIEHLSGCEDGVEIIGFVVEGSSISTIRFEVSQKQPLEEGMIIFVNVNDSLVYYQILDAETSEESFSQNPRGTHIVKAAQLGTFSPDEGFRKFAWLPVMNQPVFRGVFDGKEEDEDTSRFEVGTLPFSDIAIYADLKKLIEYHAAILGITGTGKTDLSLDVIRAAAQNEVKVICVDITGEYRRMLNIDSSVLSIEEGQYEQLEKAIFSVETGNYGGRKEKGQLKELIDETINPSIKRSIQSFMDDEKQVGFIELGEIANSKGMLTITEMYLSAIMNWAKSVWSAEGASSKSILIVLEEAHTIIPETFGSSFNHETKIIVERIGQIALQGRKYGVGLLIVSQRTALVSKTILSQGSVKKVVSGHGGIAP